MHLGIIKITYNRTATHFMDERFVNLGEEVILTLLWQCDASESATVCFVISLNICYWLFKCRVLHVCVCMCLRVWEREGERERGSQCSIVCVCVCVCVCAALCERGDMVTQPRLVCQTHELTLSVTQLCSRLINWWEIIMDYDYGIGALHFRRWLVVFGQS